MVIYSRLLLLHSIGSEQGGHPFFFTCNVILVCLVYVWLEPLQPLILRTMGARTSKPIMSFQFRCVVLLRRWTFVITRFIVLCCRRSWSNPFCGVEFHLHWDHTSHCRPYRGCEVFEPLLSTGKRNTKMRPTWTCYGFNKLTVNRIRLWL